MYKKFCLLFICLSMALSALVVVVNLIVDPYEVWGIYRRVGFNMFSPRAEDMTRLQKPLFFLRLDPQPETVFIGTSQVLYALDMDVYGEMTGKAAYNFAMPACTMYESRRALEHVLASDNQVKDVYIGLMFFMFLSGGYNPLPQTMPAFKDVDSQYGVSHFTLDSLLKTVFSWEALNDGKNKVKANYQSKWTQPCYMDSGKLNDELLLEKEKRIQNRFTRYLASSVGEGSYNEVQLRQDNFEELIHMLELCAARGVNVHLFIPPMHAQQLEAEAECWPVYEEWQRTLAEISPFMDFCNYNEMTMSPVRSGGGDENTNRYFWNTSHMKTEMGNLVLASLLCAPSAVPGLGVNVTSDNVEEHLRIMREGRKAWEAAHPESPEEVRYYGVSSVFPQILRGRQLQQGRSLVRIEAAGAISLAKFGDWRERQAKLGRYQLLDFTLSRREYLHLEGVRLTTPGEPQAMFAVLENSVGQRYYALAQIRGSQTVANLLNDRAYLASSGFYLKMPLRNVPMGTYSLSFIEVAEDGQAYQSEALGTIGVTD